MWWHGLEREVWMPSCQCLQNERPGFESRPIGPPWTGCSEGRQIVLYKYSIKDCLLYNYFTKKLFSCGNVFGHIRRINGIKTLLGF